jgi:hypothetical protein
METMVDIENTFWLAALSNSVALPIAAEETTRMSNQHTPAGDIKLPMLSTPILWINSRCFTGGKVENRISNAAHDATYLPALTTRPQCSTGKTILNERVRSPAWPVCPARRSAA